MEELVEGEGGGFPFFVGLCIGELGYKGVEGRLLVPPAVGFLQNISAYQVVER